MFYIFDIDTSEYIYIHVHRIRYIILADIYVYIYIHYLDNCIIPVPGCHAKPGSGHGRRCHPGDDERGALVGTSPMGRKTIEIWVIQ